MAHRALTGGEVERVTGDALRDLNRHGELRLEEGLVELENRP